MSDTPPQPKRPGRGGPQNSDVDAPRACEAPEDGAFDEAEGRPIKKDRPHYELCCRPTHMVDPDTKRPICKGHLALKRINQAKEGAVDHG